MGLKLSFCTSYNTNDEKETEKNPHFYLTIKRWTKRPPPLAGGEVARGIPVPFGNFVLKGKYLKHLPGGVAFCSLPAVFCSAHTAHTLRVYVSRWICSYMYYIIFMYVYPVRNFETFIQNYNNASKVCTYANGIHLVYLRSHQFSEAAIFVLVSPVSL